MGAANGDAGIGLAATIGALQTGFADRPGPYRLRLLRMLGVAVAAGTTSALAVAASRHGVLSVLLLVVLAFGAGLLLSAGPAATQFGVAATAAALILGHTPEPSSAAVHVGLLVVLGGAVQTLLAVAAWPLRRHRPERVALAALYRELANAARAQRGTVAGPPAGDALGDARDTLYGLGHDHGPSVEAYRVLLDEAERIRRELIVVTSFAERLAEQRNPILAGLVRGSLTAAASVLDDVAAALDAGRAVDEDVSARARRTVGHTVDRLEDSVDAPAAFTRRATASRLRALSGQLRAVVQSSRTGASEGRRGERHESPTGRLLHDPVALVRANLAPDSAVLRHAARLAVVVGASDTMVRAAGLDRGYWVALTLLVVLRPDFGTTLQRSAMRTAGTVLGLIVATELVHWLPGGDWWHVALVAVFAFGMRLSGPANVAPTAVSLSALVVVLLQIQGVPARDTVVDRAVATLAGGALAVLATLAFPAWERRFVVERLVALLRAYGDYLAAVVDPDTDRRRLLAVRAACRLARTNAQASVDRAAAEPVRGQPQVELGRTVLAHSHRFVHAALTLDAVRVPLRDAGGLARITPFATRAGEVLGALAEAVASQRPPPRSAALRPEQEALFALLDEHPETVGGPGVATAVAEATDRITDSLDSLVAELRRQREPAPLALASGDDQPRPR
ncbi:Uncharacterized membrane protein YccC [Jatrophihabitans endophyticus]|uniref:Uncharacterized membrane protein YccC n=1 Tax=Jatrophihabitans endophyticus TaxID=1206085 RepID=A0A1M5CBA9_9ACTN|nr:FUSC family protein [Jatrophihabitans endophyticus]SHF51980.1 Uncharacterized membrane protein YccC [Jatrophihabitans endophyticus]